MRERFNQGEVWMRSGLPLNEMLEYAYHSGAMQSFRTRLFHAHRADPQGVGLFGPKVQKALGEMGVLGYAESTSRSSSPTTSRSPMTSTPEVRARPDRRRSKSSDHCRNRKRGPRGPFFLRVVVRYRSGDRRQHTSRCAAPRRARCDLRDVEAARADPGLGLHEDREAGEGIGLGFGRRALARQQPGQRIEIAGREVGRRDRRGPSPRGPRSSGPRRRVGETGEPGAGVRRQRVGSRRSGRSAPSPARPSRHSPGPRSCCRRSRSGTAPRRSDTRRG